MSSQGWRPPPDIDAEKDDQQKVATERSNQQWRTQQMLQSAYPSSSTRIIDWRRF